MLHAPGIQSIPGALNPTSEYQKLQRKQNTQQYQRALKSGASTIPTIVKSQAFGKDVTQVQGDISGGPGFISLKNEQSAGPAKNLWLQELRQANCSARAIQKVSSEGASVADIAQVCRCSS